MFLALETELGAVAVYAERLTLTHWSAASVAEVFGIFPRDAAELVV